MTDHICDLSPCSEDPEFARALLYQHGLPEEVIDGALALHAQELAALQRLRMDELDLTGQKARIVGRIVDLIDPTRTAAPVSSPAADQTALRDRIAEVLLTTSREDWPYTPGQEKWDHHKHGDRLGHTYSISCALCTNDVDRLVDAVLAVLPPHADRAAILANVERAIRTATHNCGYTADAGCDFCNGVETALEQVRRLADETQPTEGAKEARP